MQNLPEMEPLFLLGAPRGGFAPVPAETAMGESRGEAEGTGDLHCMARIVECRHIPGVVETERYPILAGRMPSVERPVVCPRDGLEKA